MTFHSVDVIVIGGGPAGCAAATTAARNRWKTILIDAAAENGFLGSRAHVDYFPGIAEPTTGADLIRRLHEQAQLAGVQLRHCCVTGVAFGGEHLQMTASDGDTYGARAVVAATGAAVRSNYLPGEREFLGRGVSHDAALDGPAFFQRRIAVIGKTRHAAEEALQLTRFAGHVVFIIPSSKLDIDEPLHAQIRDNNKIEPLYSASLKTINGGDHVNSISVFTGGQEKEIGVEGVFSYVHEYQPTTGLLKDAVALAENGAVKIDGGFHTSAKGVFACGDILCARPQIPVIAAAQGVLAGLSVDNYLSIL